MHIYEINALVWLNTLSQQHNQPVTLANVPENELSWLVSLGVDAVWLMGVWERSPKGIKVATEHPGLQDEYRETLPDLTDADIAGSPYAIYRYEVAEQIGGRAALSAFYKQLQAAGLKLILDFVPNHVAVDHPWTSTHPDALVQGNATELKADPDSFIAVADDVFANGRDPYFPAWSDTIQVNAFSATYRQLSIETLRDIATLCDGVRCDMAMLLVNEVFSKTWSLNRVGDVPSDEYWEVVIPAVRQQAPDFVFMAEVYWDMEYKLQQQGFDYCYDKRLYDRMRNENAISINGHLFAELGYQLHLMRFIENHDEPRAMSAFGRERSRMAAILMATLPGGKLWHEGQFYGHRVKLPVQLGRRPKERDDSDLFAFYKNLIAEVQRPVFQQGAWQHRTVTHAWPENDTNEHLIAFTWQLNDQRVLVVVNYSPIQSQGRVPMPGFDLEQATWKLTDKLDNGKTYHRDGVRMTGDGLYVELKPWKAHIFDVERL